MRRWEPMKPKPIVLVDGMNLAYRMYHAKGNLADSKGRSTGVLHSFLEAIANLKRDLQPTRIIICWDGEGPGWRVTRVDKEYKKHRRTDPEIQKARTQVYKQVRLLQEVFQYLEIENYSIPSLEGDDLIGILSAALPRPIVIHSGDKDLFQCLEPGVTVLKPIPQGKMEKWTEKTLLERFGLKPSQWVGYLALAGDTTDGYKPIPGVGGKTALKLLADGVDPSVREFRSLAKDVRKTHSGLEVYWQSIRSCYYLASVPRYPDKGWEWFAPETLDQLHVLTESVQRPRKRTLSDVSKMWFIAFCADYELNFILGRRREFFQ